MNLSFWQRGYLDPEMNAAACSIISVIGRTPLTENIPARVKPFFQADDLIQFNPPTVNTPRLLRVSSPGNLLVFMAGAENEEMNNRIIDSWGAHNSGVTGPYDVQTDAWHSVDYWTNNQPLVLFDGFTFIRIFGHSFGGTCGQVMTMRCKRDPLTQNVFCNSYGSPKLGWKAAQRPAWAAGNVRFMLEGDYVPWLPPAFSEAPALWLWKSDLAHFRWIGDWVHIPNGWHLRANGSIFRQETVEFSESTIVRDIGLTMMGAFVEDAFAHKIEQYQNWFNARVGGPIVPPAGNVMPTPEVPELLTSTQRSRLIEEGADILRADAASPTSIVRDWQVTRVDPTQDSRYRARKRGSIWLVTRQGVTVDVGPGKRRAKSIARKMNRAATV